jgi:hypothetical protein
LPSFECMLATRYSSGMIVLVLCCSMFCCSQFLTSAACPCSGLQLAARARFPGRMDITPRFPMPGGKRKGEQRGKQRTWRCHPCLQLVLPFHLMLT